MPSKPIAWDAKDGLLNSGQITCIWNGFTIESRENDYAFTSAYMENRQVVVVKADSPVKTLADLAQKNVITQADSTAYHLLSQGGAQESLGATFAQLQTIGEYNTAFMMLESGAVDAIAADYPVATFNIGDKKSSYRILDESLSSEHYGVGFAKGATGSDLGDHMGKRVYLGMSGGVDSALSAALLLEQGYDVHAVYMRNWSRDLPGFKCTWADDLADAERVCVTLGIDLAVWDCEREYKETVVDYLVDAYARGYTPNPDVMCNQTVKFGTFAERAFAEGADFVATGHYARRTTDDAGAAHLLRAADEHKDQTYFLWRVAADTFARTIFPVGDIASKAEVRRMCAERGLGVERKPDSDGICFIGPVGIRTFLLDTLDRRAGDVVEWETGRVLGRHDGAFLFTVGQRKGLNLGGGPARYVVSTDVEKNVVYVTADRDCPALWCTSMELSDARWIGGAERASELEGRDLLVRTRHTGELAPARVTVLDDVDAAPASRVRIDFAEPRRTVAPGQSAVVYDGLECLGGGIIERDDSGGRR